MTEPSEGGLYRDAAAALDYLRSRSDVRRDRVVYFGRSLGAGVAVDLAKRAAPFGLVLESPIPSVQYMVRRVYVLLPLVPFVRSRYDALRKITSVHVPTLVIHGDRDETVPISAGKSVFDAANAPKWFHAVHGAGHDDTYLVGGEPYFARLRDFVEGLGPAGSGDPGGGQADGR